MSRRAARLLALATTGAALVMTAVPASAATKPKVITLAEARLLLPAEKSMPSDMSLQLVMETPHGAGFAVCASLADQDGISASAAQVTGLYAANDFALDGSPLTWQVSATVFHNAAKATAGMAAIIKAEHRCPLRQTLTPGVDGSTASLTITRALHERYATSGWHGYRTVDHMAENLGGEGHALGVVQQDVFLQKGNVVLHVAESAISTDGSGPKQDRYRSQVTRLLVNAFDSAN